MDQGTEVQRAREYQRKKQVSSLIHMVLTPCVLLLFVLTPLSAGLKAAAEGTAGGFYPSFALYFLFYSLAMLVYDLPFAWYSGYWLEKKYGLSNQGPGGWAAELGKKLALSFVLSLLLMMCLFALIRNFPDRWWLFAWAGFAVVSYVLGKLFPVFIVPLFYKYGPVANETLRDKIFTLAKRYGMPVENVYSLNLSKTTKKANAAFMGMGKTKRVVLSDTLIENFTQEEIEVVVGHELGHFKNKDIWRQLALGLVTSLVTFWVAFKAADPAARAAGFDGLGDIASLPLLFLIFYGVTLVLTPLQSGFSRMLERAADRFALKAFPDRDVFISCMDKLAKVNLADPQPHPVYEWFFYDHPSIHKRIEMARKWKGT